MKNIIAIYLLLGVLVGTSCQKDNYDPPSSTLQGRIVYQGEPINVSTKDTYFELWEPGWGKNGAINIPIKEDGSYSALLFNGNYKLVIPASQGPFRSIPDSETKTDTMLLTLGGNKTLDIEVLPYYMIRNTTFAVSGSNLMSTFKIEQIITDANARNIENVFLYINQTTFVNGSNYVARASIGGGDITDPNQVNMQVAIPAKLSANGATGTQNYAYARVGIKIAGVEDLLFSPVQKINL
jgi:hypothetical protein